VANVSTWVDSNDHIVLQAGAQQIFKGILEDYIEEYRQFATTESSSNINIFYMILSISQ